jgi:hypothetical protein
LPGYQISMIRKAEGLLMNYGPFRNIKPENPTLAEEMEGKIAHRCFFLPFPITLSL